MSDMTERVARAIAIAAEQRHGGTMMEWAISPEREDCLAFARAAIEAMREPTEEMLDAASEAEDALKRTALVHHETASGDKQPALSLTGETQASIPEDVMQAAAAAANAWLFQADSDGEDLILHIARAMIELRGSGPTTSIPQRMDGASGDGCFSAAPQAQPPEH